MSDLEQTITANEKMLRRGLRGTQRCMSEIRNALKFSDDLSAERRARVESELRDLARIETYLIGALSNLPEDRTHRCLELLAHTEALVRLCWDDEPPKTRAA